MKFIDANIFLEIMLEDKNADRCFAFFDNMNNEDTEIATSDYIIYTGLLQIESKIRSLKLMEEFIYYINNIKNLRIIRPSIKVIYNSLSISDKYNLDYEDSIILQTAISTKSTELVSFDKHFDKVKEIKRIEP